ncbi:hypothetical protein HHI36_008521 [Cryptolaemus montrouzieri]|uniref:Ionotropic glutamate receptor C-terminal domain-containing protein n=1 Tax=Cryptolaemus montrouzieri TaxID=559131 RepID=A0ABD2MST8_9CUCU
MLLESLQIVFIISKFTPVKSDRGHLILFIQDFLSKQQIPANIDTYLCWEKHEQLQLQNLLWKNEYRVRLNMDEEVKFDIPYIEEHHLFLVDLSCEYVDELFQKANNKFLFKQPFRWIVIGNISDILLKKLAIGIDSQFFVIREKGEGFYIEAPYKYSTNSSIYTKNEIASWKQGEFGYYNYLNTGRNRTDLKGTVMKISYVITNPISLNHLWDYRYKHVDTISKLNYLLTNYLMDYVNASREYIVRPSWGYKLKNSSFYDGMVGDLQTDIAELGGTASFFTPDRIEIVDYISPTRTFMKFIFRSPPLSYVSNIFVLPFDIYVWFACFGILVLTCILIYVSIAWEWKEESFKENIIEDINGTLKPSVANIVLLEISAITQQGYAEEPKSAAGRIASVVLFISVIFLYTSYSASIVVLLQSTTDTIQTVQDLLDSRIKLGAEDIVYSHYYFESAKQPLQKAIYEQKVAPKGQKSNFMSVIEGMRLVQNDFFAFHVELSTGYKVVGDIFKESEKCGLQEITLFNIIEPWLPIRKNSTYKDIFKIGMGRLHEHGLKQREVLRTYTKKPVCQSNNSNFVNVGLIDCYFAFVIFGVGIFLSLIMMGAEVIFSKYTVKRAKHGTVFVKARE